MRYCPYVDVRTLLTGLLAGQRLSEAQAEALFESLLAGRFDDAQIAAILSLIQVRGPSVDELVGAARTMRRHATPVPFAPTDPARASLLDTCGTGGAIKTFNISTVVAIVAAAATPPDAPRRIYVAKHGNRSRTGRGSAELLARLGVNVDAPPDVQAACLREAGVCFCFAIHHHPAARHAAAARRSLGVPTMFNLLGPLTNPACAPRQLLGVFDRAYVEPMAQALLRLGAHKAMVVHSDDGLDEISTMAPTTIAHVHAGRVAVERFDPNTLGAPTASVAELQARDLEDAAARATGVLRGQPGPARDIVLLNAAAALVVGDVASDLRAGLRMAAQAIDSGAAANTLELLARLSHAGLGSNAAL